MYFRELCCDHCSPVVIVYYMSRPMTKPTKRHGPSEDYDQPGLPPSLIRVFVVHTIGSYGLNVSWWGQRRLFCLGRCPGWSESSLSTQVILFVLSCGGSYSSWFKSLPRSTSEPRHDNTNKVTVRPAKTQISLGIRPVWSESSLCAQWVAKDPSFLHADSEDWSEWADAQADLSLRWAHTHFVGFVMSRLKYTK